ncbi:unnamed protein product [Orchesella dallaii]|uniref:Uncharacterized protein n=1 Tax=Orchesella dallaii TaxID=48710 RepID=A0ABP1R4E0_9HEXA
MHPQRVENIEIVKASNIGSSEESSGAGFGNLIPASGMGQETSSTAPENDHKTASSTGSTTTPDANMQVDPNFSDESTEQIDACEIFYLDCPIECIQQEVTPFQSHPGSALTHLLQQFQTFCDRTHEILDIIRNNAGNLNLEECYHALATVESQIGDLLNGEAEEAKDEIFSLQASIDPAVAKERPTTDCRDTFTTSTTTEATTTKTSAPNAIPESLNVSAPPPSSQATTTVGVVDTASSSPPSAASISHPYSFLILIATEVETEDSTEIDEEQD